MQTFCTSSRRPLRDRSRRRHGAPPPLRSASRSDGANAGRAGAACESLRAAIDIQQSARVPPGWGAACPAARLFRVGPEPVKSACGVGLSPDLRLLTEPARESPDPLATVGAGGMWSCTELTFNRQLVQHAVWHAQATDPAAMAVPIATPASTPIHANVVQVWASRASRSNPSLSRCSPRRRSAPRPSSAQPWWLPSRSGRVSRSRPGGGAREPPFPAAIRLPPRPRADIWRHRPASRRQPPMTAGLRPR